jgi:hypothetical protein
VSAHLAFTKALSASRIDPDSVRLVSFNGMICDTTCPHLRHDPALGIHACNGILVAPVLLSIVLGGTRRCVACRRSASSRREDSERAERAMKRLNELRARKGTMTKVAKRDNVEGRAENGPEPKKRATDLVEKRKDTRHLKVILSALELEERADLSSHIWAEHCATETEAKTIASNFKSKVAELRGKHDTLQREIRDKCSYRDVECEMEFDYEKRRVTVRRGDTGMIVEDREMLSEEFTIWQSKRKQTKLQFPEPTDAKRDTAPPEDPSKKLNDESDRTASELKARAKKNKKS